MGAVSGSRAMRMVPWGVSIVALSGPPVAVPGGAAPPGDRLGPPPPPPAAAGGGAGAGGGGGRARPGAAGREHEPMDARGHEARHELLEGRRAGGLPAGFGEALWTRVEPDSEPVAGHAQAGGPGRAPPRPPPPGAAPPRPRRPRR